MKLKNKIVILLFILISFLSININCFATSTETEKNVINYQGYEFPEFPSDYDNYDYKLIVFYSPLNSYDLLLSDNPFYYSSDINFIDGYLHNGDSIDDTFYDYIYSLSPANVKRYNFNPSLDNSSWIFKRFSEGMVVYFETNTYHIIYSNFNVINDDDNSTFFYKTPFLHFTNTQSNFAKSFFQPLARVLAVVVPVGVVILAVLVTVSLIAYFKFWRI